jgi:hypothetical protein
MADKIKKSVKPPVMTSGKNELNDIVENNDKEDAVLEQIDEIADPSQLVPGKTRQLEAPQREHITNLLVDILNEIENDRKFLDTHSKTIIAESIEKKLESEKENNLAVMKDLDKESRQSLTNMIKLGAVTWKNLSKKQDLDLHFDEIVEEGDQPNGENEFEPVQYDEDIDDNLRETARLELGDNFTNEAFTQWNETRQANEREDRENMADGAAMPDDDGDGADGADGDDAYY